MESVNVRDKSRGNVSLVLGILSIITSIFGVAFIIAIIGLIYGIIDLIKIKRYKQNGKRKTTVGIVFCLLGIILTMIFSMIAGYMLMS